MVDPEGDKNHSVGDADGVSVRVSATPGDGQMFLCVLLGRLSQLMTQVILISDTGNPVSCVQNKFGKTIVCV